MSYINGVLAEHVIEPPEPQIVEVEVDEEQDDEEVMEEEEQESLSNTLILPRQALLSMITRQKQLIRELPPVTGDIQAFYETFSIDTCADIFERYNVAPNHEFIQGINDQLQMILLSITKSAYANQVMHTITHNYIQLIFDSLLGQVMLDNAPNRLLSQTTIIAINNLRDTLLFGNVMKAHTTILFVDGDVSITESDVDNAIADVKGDAFLHDLLVSTVDDTEGDQ